MVRPKIVQPRRMAVDAPALLRLFPSPATAFLVHNSAAKQMDHGVQDLPSLIESLSNIHQRELCVKCEGATVASLIWIQQRMGHDASEMGTYVAQGFRRRGIAVALWREMLRIRGVRDMRVVVVSREGDALARALVRHFPDVAWKVEREAWRNT